MWKRLSIFLAVFLLVVSSLSAYPSWVYGRGKQETAAPEETAQETSVIEPAQIAPEVEPEVERSTVPEVPETSLTAGSESLSKTLQEQGENLTNSLNDSKVKATALTQVSDYIDNAVLGVEVMEQAYELEVANYKELETKYNALANRRFEKDFYVTVNPYAGYSPLSQTWGLGINTVYSYRGVGLSVGAYVPTVNMDGLKNVIVTAGLAFTF